MPRDPHSYLTPADIAKAYGIGLRKVLAWIASGELRAINVAGCRGGKPRWRISAAAIDDFERSRTALTTPPTARRSRRRDPAYVQYF